MRVDHAEISHTQGWQGDQAGIVVFIVISLSMFIAGFSLGRIADNDVYSTVAFACGYRVHQDKTHHWDDLPIDDWCLKIKQTAAENGFNP